MSDLRYIFDNLPQIEDQGLSHPGGLEWLAILYLLDPLL